MRALAVAACLLPAFAWAADYPGVLPPDDTVRAALEQSPQIVMARERLAMAEARRNLLVAGPHEWTIGALGQRRTDAFGASFSEQSYELARGVRWFGKASLDRALGAQTAAVGEFALADAWHEAARVFLADWFGWLCASQEARLLAEQTVLLEEQLAKVHSRVRAGDAPRVEALLAQTEIDRAAAVQMAADLQERKLALELRRDFPGFEPALPANLDVPVEPSGTDEEWAERILGDNHEVELAEGQLEQARLAVRRAQRDRLPDPTVALRFSNNIDGNDRVVGINVIVPIGGARRRAESDVASREASIAGQQARETRLKVESDARRAILSMRSTHSQWLRLRDVAAQSESNAAAVARGYALGEFTIAELLAARRQHLDAVRAATVARLDALESQVRLRLDAHEIWALAEHGAE